MNPAGIYVELPIGFRFPMLFSGCASVCEWYDDAQEKFRIAVTVTNRVWGRLFGYDGSFAVEYCPVERAPLDVRPVREERRE